MAEAQSKVALFLRYFGGGGAERVMLNLACGFVERGLQVDLVLAKAWGPHLEKVPDDIRIVDLNSPRSPASILTLTRYLRQERPDALLSGMHYANEIAICAKRLAGVPTRVVVSEHNTLSHSLKYTAKLKRLLVPLFVRNLYPLADGIVAVSKGAAKDLVQVGKLPPHRVEAIYNPVITPELLAKAKAPIDHPWFSEGEPPVILGVGKLETQKDFPTLIRAFALVRKERPARLAILGWGPDQSKLEALIRELHLDEHAKLLGYQENPYPYMSRAAVFVLSSLWEGLPTVLIEAMAVGTPVVSTDCKSGPDEILDCGKYGRMSPTSNPELLAKEILKVLAGDRPEVDPDWLNYFRLNTVTEQYLNYLKIG